MMYSLIVGRTSWRNWRMHRHPVGARHLLEIPVDGLRPLSRAHDQHRRRRDTRDEDRPDVAEAPPHDGEQRPDECGKRDPDHHEVGEEVADLPPAAHREAEKDADHEDDRDRPESRLDADPDVRPEQVAVVAEELDDLDRPRDPVDRRAGQRPEHDRQDPRRPHRGEIDGQRSPDAMSPARPRAGRTDSMPRRYPASRGSNPGSSGASADPRASWSARASSALVRPCLPRVAPREDPRSAGASRTRSITITKMTKNIIHESASSTENVVNALWIWKPTPLALPNVSVRASSFHESANETRAAASRNGSTAGNDHAPGHGRARCARTPGSSPAAPGRPTPRRRRR